MTKERPQNLLQPKEIDMSRTVQLVDKSGNAIGSVVLPSDFPSDPNLVQIGDRLFQGQGSYFVETYQQIDEPLKLPESAITPPSS